MTTLKESDYKSIHGEGINDYSPTKVAKAAYSFKKWISPGDFIERGVGTKYGHLTVGELSTISKRLVPDEDPPSVYVPRELAQS